jgi:hypothetical protein
MSFVYAQGTPSIPKLSNDPDTTSKPVGNYAIGVNQRLSELENRIKEKISNLEKLQSKASELNKGLKERVFIADEVPAMAQDGTVQIVNSRRIEFTFQADKAIELKIISSKKNIKNDLHSVVRTLTFTPTDFSSIKIKVDKFDSQTKGVPEIKEYGKMQSDAKLAALKVIDLVLFNTIFRFDTLIQKAENDSLDNTKKNLEEL